MRQVINAVFARGGSSNALIFHERDLPADKTLWDPLFRHVMGSPDPYGRQLDGMGGGISSLSKIVIVAPSLRDDADVDYTFVQVGVRDGVVDYGMFCGNMAASVGPFAVDEGVVPVADGLAVIRVYNTNTDKIYHARFMVAGGLAVEAGTFTIPGVSGSGARIDLEFINPGGARTVGFLPTGQACDRFMVPNVGAIDVSCVDATNPVVFLRAADLGVDATALPQQLDTYRDLAVKIEAIRRHAAVAMGMAPNADAALQSNPKIGVVAPPADLPALDGTVIPATDMDVIIKMVSMENFHRAIPLSSSMCAAAAAAVPGTVVHAISTNHAPLRIGTASGVVEARAMVSHRGNSYHADSAATSRTQRRLFQGQLPVPAEWLPKR